MKYESGLIGFYLMVSKHIKYGHKEEAIIIPSEGHSLSYSTNSPYYEKLKRKASIEELVKKMTEMAVIKVEEMEPSQVKLNEVFAGHRVLLESKKLKLSEDAMMIALSKMFGPVLQGEVVENAKLEGDKDGNDGSGRTENVPDQSQDSP
jgi:hypothetical protein